MQAKFDAHMQALKAEQEAQAAAFWEALSADGGVQVLPSGLAYKIGQAGSGPKPTPVDTVRAHYTGRLIDGTVFDSSAGGEPFQTQLNRVIPGWTEGLGLIGAGGMITLYVPAKLGYGDEGSGDIPPGATLIFEVELVEVIPVELPAEPSEE
jgi:FKBP-type peptidyl-prolyl cis-trans isomerase